VNVSGLWNVVANTVSLAGNINPLGFGLNIQQNGTQIQAVSAPYVDANGMVTLANEVATGTLSGSSLTLTISDPDPSTDGGTCIFYLQGTASNMQITGNYAMGAPPESVCYIQPGSFVMTPQAVVLASQPKNPVGLTSVSVGANDLAWDPVYGKIYLSIPSTAPSNANSVQPMDPVTGILETPISVGKEPDMLSVSSKSEYLYVGLDGAGSVQRLTLPSLSSGIQIALGSDPSYGSYLAMDLQAAPNADETVAVVRSNSDCPTNDTGGVVIYDNSIARSGVLCGWEDAGCTNSPGAYDSIQWNSDGSEMFAGFGDFYTIPVSSSGFGAVINYFQLVGLGAHIHYDGSTKLVYDDSGSVIDPNQGVTVGSFNVSSFNTFGLMVPDGALGKAFFLGHAPFLGQDTNVDPTTYTLGSFDIQTFAPIATLTIYAVSGTPSHLIRWGSNGLAFTTASAVYIYSGSFVGPTATNATSEPIPRKNVQRTWKPVRPAVF